MALRSPSGKPKLLAPTRPNIGVEVAYRKRLDTLIAEMNTSLLHWLSAQWRENTPELAADRSPAADLNTAFQRLALRWQRRFNQLAPSLAAHFATTTLKRSDASLRASLKRAGMSVKFTLTKPQNDALQACVSENVGLIRSIASDHLTDVQGIVMRSVKPGGNLFEMRKEIQARYGLTKKRAALITRDQNSKAHATFQQARYVELGITKAVWMHSTAGKHPRPSHVTANGKTFDPAVGLYLDGVWTIPGREINCRCVQRPLLG